MIYIYLIIDGEVGMVRDLLLFVVFFFFCGETKLLPEEEFEHVDSCRLREFELGDC